MDLPVPVVEVAATDPGVSRSNTKGAVDSYFHISKSLNAKAGFVTIRENTSKLKISAPL